MKTSLKLLNSKKIIDCNGKEIEKHNKEIEELFDMISSAGDYECALVCKYQDRWHKKEKQKIISSSLSNIANDIQVFDCKNGLDFYINEQNYIVIIMYGQCYSYDNEYYILTLAIQILPYDRDKNFLDISKYIVNKEAKIEISKEQFENKLYS